MVKKKFPILIISILFLFIGLTSAITFQQIFPTTNPFITPLPNVTISTGVHCPDGCSSFTHSWNGTNTTLYDSSLVLFMNFDNRSALGENDTFVRDLSMYGNNGSVVGGENITWGSTYGKYNGAFNFSGNVNIINVPDSDSLTNNYTSMSWSFWAKNTKTSAGYLDKYSTSGQRSWKITQSNSGNEIVVTLTSILSTGTSYTSNALCGVGSDWTHILIVYNGTSLLYYKGGSLCYTNNSVTQALIVNNAFPLYIGYSSGNSAYLNGSIDDVMIWNRSLSASEILQLYNTQITKYNSTYYQYNVTEIISAYFQPTSFLCSINSTGSNFCSASQKIIQTMTLKSNFSTSKGIINNYFYGTNTHGIWGSNYSYVNLTSGQFSDYSWHISSMLNANLNYIRVDARFSQIAFEDGTFNTTSTITNSNNINLVKSTVKFACNNNMKVLLIGGPMPNWLANQTSGWCNITGSVANSTCSPSNYSRYTELWVDYINYVTENGLYINCIEIDTWNEPDINTSFLNNITNENSIRYNEFNKLYNSTWDVKNTFPTIKIGAGAVNSQYYNNGSSGKGLLDNWLNENANRSDYISFSRYKYESNVNYDTSMQEYLNNITNMLIKYNSNITKIIIVEMGINGGVRTATNYTATYSNGLQFLLNNYPSNITSIQYQWSSVTVNDTWNMVSENGVDYPFNKFYNLYNVTSNFAHLCPAGGEVFLSSGDDSDIKQVSCKKGNQYSLIVINTGTTAKNITLNMSMTNGTVIFNYPNLRSYEDDTTTYKVSSDGISQLGVMDSYEILYLYSGVEDGALLRGVFKLNEGSGNTIYDSLQNLSNGVKSGATWVTDGVLNTLTSVVDYTISTSGLFVVSSSYLFNYMNSSWSYLATWRDTGSTASLVMVDSLGNSTTFLSLLIVISFAVVILTLFKPSVNTNPLGKPHY